MSNDFSDFADLPDVLQLEAIREGEERLRSQLAVATAADARALSWASLLIAAVTGAFGAGFVALSRNKPDFFLALVALGFAGLMLKAAMTALETVHPREWHFPGNTPAYWRPTAWDCVGSDRAKVRRARIE